MSVRSFTITTSGQRGPRLWWYVRIYPHLQSMRAAATRYDPASDFSEAHAVCHTACYTTLTGGPRFSQSTFAGIIRLTDGHLHGELITHELIHAACAIYRMTVAPDIRLGRGVTENEEQLAYIYGELYTSLTTHLQPRR